MLTCQTTNLITLPWKYKNIHHKLQFTKAASPIAEKSFNDHIQTGIVCCHSKLSGQVEALFCLLRLYCQFSFCTCRKVSKLWNSPKQTQIQVDNNLSSYNFINTHRARYYELYTEKSDTPSLHWLRGFLLPFGLISLRADWRSAWKHIYPAVLYGYASMHIMLNPRSCLSSQSLIFLILSRVLKS